MPRVIEFSQRTVNITNQHLLDIVEYYKTALDGANINIGTLADTPGLIGKVLAFIEYATGAKVGAEKLTLAKISVELDAKVADIVNDYRHYLNVQLVASNCSLRDVANETIEHPSILVTELILRLVAVAFSTNVLLEKIANKK